jgi:hypothetical protein
LANGERHFFNPLDAEPWRHSFHQLPFDTGKQDIRNEAHATTPRPAEAKA